MQALSGGNHELVSRVLTQVLPQVEDPFLLTELAVRLQGLGGDAGLVDTALNKARRELGYDNVRFRFDDRSQLLVDMGVGKVNIGVGQVIMGEEAGGSKESVNEQTVQALLTEEEQALFGYKVDSLDGLSSFARLRMCFTVEDLEAASSLVQECVEKGMRKGKLNSCLLNPSFSKHIQVIHIYTFILNIHPIFTHNRPQKNSRTRHTNPTQLVHAFGLGTGTQNRVRVAWPPFERVGRG